MSVNKNLELYNKVRAVPSEACKDFSANGFSGTDINPMWRIKTLTDNFGPAGTGWYISDVKFWSETLDTEVATFCTINLYVKEGEGWSQPIFGIGGSRSIKQFTNKRVVSDEGYKMAYTDAISVACKALGIGADVYYKKDVTKYTQDFAENAERKSVNNDLTLVLGLITNAKSLEELQKIWNDNIELQSNGEFLKAIQVQDKNLRVFKSGIKN